MALGLRKVGMKGEATGQSRAQALECAAARDPKTEEKIAGAVGK